MVIFGSIRLSIMNDDSETLVLFFKGLAHYLGKTVNKVYREAKREYYTSLKGKLECGICGEKMSWKEQRTVDHIIPKNIIWEYGPAPLYFDVRNFRAAHPDCNSKRGVLTLDDLPLSIKDKLEKRKQLVYSD